MPIINIAKCECKIPIGIAETHDYIIAPRPRLYERDDCSECSMRDLCCTCKGVYKLTDEVMFDMIKENDRVG